MSWCSRIGRIAGALVLLACCAVAGAEPGPWVPVSLLARSTDEPVRVKLEEGEWQWLRKKRTLILGVTAPDYAPFDITFSGSELEGITADYMGMIANTLNVKVEVRRYPDRNAAVEALFRGDIDLLSRSTLFETSIYPNIVLSHPYFTNQPVIIGPENVPIENYRKVAGKRISVVSDYFSSDDIAKHFSDAILLPSPSVRQALESVAFGQADLYIGDAFSAQYLISQGYLANLKMLNFATFNGAGFSFAMRKSDAPLTQIIDRTLDAIPVQAEQAIQKRWYASGAYSIAHQRLVLTPQEKRWLERNPHPVIVVDEALAPVSFFDSHRNFRGISADLLELIRARTGLEFDVRAEHGINAMLGEVRRGRAKAIVALTPTIQREEWLNFSRPYMTASFVVVVKRNADWFRHLDDLNGHRVAVPAGSVLVPFMREHYPGVSVVEVESNADDLAMISEGKIDAGIHLLSSANYLISRYYSDLRVAAALDRDPGEFSIAVSQTDPELLSILNKAILAISPDDMANIISRWSASVESPDSVWEGYRTRMLQVLWGAILILALFLLWNWCLQLKVRRRQVFEKELNYRLEFKRAVIDGIPHPIAVLDRNGRYLTCNRSFLESAGVSREAVQGARITDFQWLPAEDALALDAEYRQVMEDGVPYARDRVLRLRERLLEVYHWATPYRGGNGEVMGLVCGWIDVTERERLLHQLEAAKDQAEAANRAKSTFLATMSHEIRTPMNAVIGMLELALTRAEQGRWDREPVEVAYDSARSLLTLIGDILDVAKIESGRLTLLPERARLRELVESVARVFDGLARQKGLELKLEMEEEAVCDVLIDPLRFKQILSNLVSNAIKFTDRGFVKIWVAGNRLVDGRIALDVTVEDSGIGVSADDQAHLFEPFSQASQRSHVSRGGTGLGLTICRKLAEMMGGTVRLESRLGQGSRVSVKLLLQVLDSLQEKDLLPAVHAPSPNHSLRVLVVDDHAANRMLLTQQLEFLGHQVEIACDGADALQIWHPGDFDVVITDCNMPVLNGYGLARRIREIECEMEMPACVIFGFTANAQPCEVKRCRDAGMDDCLFKPIGLENLRTRLDSVPQIVALDADAKLGADADTKPGDDADTKLGEWVGKEIDLRTLEEMTGKNPALIRRLLEELYSSNRVDIEQVEPLLESGDWMRLADQAHRMKGAARLVNADELQDLCSELESACRDGQDASVIGDKVLAVRDAMEKVQKGVEELLATYGKVA